MKTILLNKVDNVEVVINSDKVKASPGSKIAREYIKKGSPIRKFGVNIGIASKDIKKGSIVDHRVISELNSLSINTNSISISSTELPDHLLHFSGYLNADGSAGTRNYLCIATSVHCVSGICEHAIKVIKREILPKYENVDGVVLLKHNYGCGVAIDALDSEIPRRTLSNLMLNPNFGGYALLIGLGCEKLRHEMMLSSLSKNLGVAFNHDSLYIQSIEEKGFGAIVSEICEKADLALNNLNLRQRQRLPISKLVIGMQCGMEAMHFRAYRQIPCLVECLIFLLKRVERLCFLRIQSAWMPNLIL